MSENVNFYQGSKKNYNPSEMQGGLYFSKDSKEILLNGESYGNVMEVKDWVNEQGFARTSDLPEGLDDVVSNYNKLPTSIVGNYKNSQPGVTTDRPIYGSPARDQYVIGFYTFSPDSPRAVGNIEISIPLADVDDSDEAGLISAADKRKLDKVIDDGDGTKYLSDNGTYKTIEIPDLSNYLTEDDKTELETEIGDLTETVSTINDTVSGLDNKYLPLSGGTLDGSIYFDSALSTEENPIHELIINRSGGSQYITVGSRGRIQIGNGDIGTNRDFVTCVDTGDFLKRDPENPGISYRAVMTTTNQYAGNQMNVNYISQVTQSIYDGLFTKDANTLYIITE